MRPSRPGPGVCTGSGSSYVAKTVWESGPDYTQARSSASISSRVTPWGLARSESTCLGIEIHRLNLAKGKHCLAYGDSNSLWMNYLLEVMFKVPHGPLTCTRILHLSWGVLLFLWRWMHVDDGKRSVDDTHMYSLSFQGWKEMGGNQGSRFFP